MATSNIKLFDENKGNMLTDTEFNISTQRLNGLQTGVASSQLQNKAMYQASLVAYAIAQIMMQNGKNANDTDAVSAFVANLSGAMLQKVYDLASTEEAQAGVATGKWMSPALVKAAIDTLAAKAQNILSDATKELYGLESTATPDDVFLKLILPNGKFGFKLTFKLANGSVASGFTFDENTLHPLANQSLVADSNGIIFCYADSQSVSATFGEGYFGLAGQTEQLTADTTKPFTPVTITLANNQSLTSTTVLQDSKTYKLAGNIDEADFCAVGGGGGGSQRGTHSSLSGGGGGYVKNALSAKFDGKRTLQLTIGGGGSSGNTGGSTTVSLDGASIATAAGGKGGSAGGAGNGNGGSQGDSAGKDGTTHVFGDSSLPLPGGGGGYGNSDGGKDFGGRGNANGSTAAQSGRGPGGGGGGSNTGPLNGAYAGSGASGAVYARVRYKQ